MVLGSNEVTGHGYVKEPAARQSMWRYGFDTPVNYNDAEQNCGGFPNQWNNQDGKCGLCGDPYQDPQPRDYEAGGSMAPIDRPIARCYNQFDGVINVTIRIISHHLGYFEFRLCENNNMALDPPTECIDNGRLLTIAGTQNTKYDITNDYREYYDYQLDLPSDIICAQCILHWKYNAGNNWGCESDGCGMGKGQQEQFHNCVDIAILPDCQDTYSTATPWTTTRQPEVTTTFGPEVTTTSGPDITTTPVPEVTTTSGQEVTTTDEQGGGSLCRATGIWAGRVGMDDWCTENCLNAPPDCPSSYCECDQTRTNCWPTVIWTGQAGMNEWCVNSCLDSPPRCPQSHCQCYS